MRFLAAAAALATALIAGQAAAQATNYTFTSGPYDTLNNSTTCTVGECTTYALGQRATAILTYAAPLAPNLPFGEYSAGVIAYTFNDGVRTTTGPSPNAALYRVEFATNGSGVPTGMIMTLERTPGPPYTTLDANDPNSLFSLINFFSNRTVIVANGTCNSRGVGVFNPTPGPGACNIAGGGAQSSSAESNVSPVVTVASVHPVPTLSEWAMILFATLLAGGAALMVRRRLHLA